MSLLETFGGALFGAVLQVLFDKLNSHQVLGYFRERDLDEKLLKKFKRKLMDVNAVIDDAEQKQFSNSLVKEWVDEIRDALYDAEDLLEQIDYEFSVRELKADSKTSARKVRNFESKMREILADLESLLSQNIVQDFKISTGVRFGLGNKVSEKKVESTSLVAEEVIYGRDEDKEMILSWLTSDTHDKKLSICSIVGMGGMGKTTLAQHVFNDPKIMEARFDEKAWVCVSDEFDVLKVSKAIFETFTKSNDDSENLEMVHGKLKEKLTGRKFFLVLDDVWNEDRHQWKSLQTPLKYGAMGSKILVTTRNSNVASIMESSNINQLTQLREDHSWQVFTKHAVQDNSSTLNSEMKEIGMKIVEKCKGLPLALETLGSLLQSKSSVSDWEGVLRSNIWDLPIKDSKIIPALLLSYFDLPSHIKRCFAYCALFPKDHLFDKESLIQLWMAQNFLPCSQQGKSQEEVGEQYFNDLLARSFFKKAKFYERCFDMHDLLNDLAKYVSGEVCFRLGVDKAERIPKTTRHFSARDNPVIYHEFRSLCEVKGLRTFLSINEDTGMSIQELISNFKFLRVLSVTTEQTEKGLNTIKVLDSIGNLIHIRLLDLSNLNIQEVPDTIGNLIYLRSLDLSGTKIERLPDSTCSLCNLQVLKLNNCYFLNELPSTLHELTDLCRLELKGTTLTKVSPLLGKLKNLQVWMNVFMVVKSSEFSIKQLRGLDLQGQLLIKNLENIVNPYDALEADFKNKTHIEELYLQWDSMREIDDSMKEREILENLQPSRHLEQLSIYDYGGTRFPHWLSDNSLPNVVSLTLKDCKHCLWLPSLGLMTFLKDLTIECLHSIRRIDADFYGNSSSAFARLEKLTFTNMNEWEEWQCMTGAFPSLYRLSVKNCPKLKGHLPERLSNLIKLTIRDCGQLVALIPRAPIQIQDVNKQPYLFEHLCIEFCPSVNIPINHCYHSLAILDIIDGCDSLTTFPLDLFPKLRNLRLRQVRKLQIISQGHPHSHLCYLGIINCSEFESFLNERLFAPQLGNFFIEGMDNLKSIPKDMSVLLPSLHYLSISHCPGVEFFDGCLPSSLRSMSLSSSPKLVASLKGALGTNPSLIYLDIDEMDFECFPSEGWLPPSLTDLSIENCPNLKKLDYKSLFELSSLQKLSLRNCPILQCLPVEGLPKSISELIIQNCPLLKQRCKKEGEDWEKIAHIKTIWIDCELVNTKDEAQVGN